MLSPSFFTMTFSTLESHIVATSTVDSSAIDRKKLPTPFLATHNPLSVTTKTRAIAIAIRRDAGGVERLERISTSECGRNPSAWRWP